MKSKEKLKIYTNAEKVIYYKRMILEAQKRILRAKTRLLYLEIKKGTR